MQPRVVTVGPLATASANAVALAQSPRAAGSLALNGASSGAVTNNIALSQTTAGAAALVLNGALASQSPKVAILPKPTSIYISSAGNDSTITFTVLGLDVNSAARTEVLSGTNAGSVATTGLYTKIISITTSAASSGSGVTVGTNGIGILDNSRQVLFTSSGNDSGITITLTGTGFAGQTQSETITGANAGTVASVLSYLTITNIMVSGATAGTLTVGTNTVGISQWVNLDTWAHGTVAGQAVPTGTANFTVQVTNDDPNSYANPIAPSAVSWDSTSAGVNNATAEAQFGLGYAPAWARVVLNSGTGSVRLTLIQHGNAPY